MRISWRILWVNRTEEMKKRVWIILIAVFVAIDLCVAGFLVYSFSKTQGNITVEAGTLVKPEDFATDKVKEIAFADSMTVFEANEIGDFQVEIIADGFKRKSHIHVCDTISPVVTTKEVNIMPGEMVKPEDFIEAIEDVTKTTVVFSGDPDTQTSGVSEVTIMVSDEGNNCTIVYSTLNVVKANLNEPYKWEASDEVPKAEFFLTQDGKAEYHGAGLSFVKWHETGVYPVYLLIDDISVTVELEIVDTVAPVFTTKAETGYLKHPMDAAKMVEACSDQTEVTFTYETEPDWDWNKEEPQIVTIVATDLGGNTAKSTAELTLIPDEEAPYIIGAGNISIVLGESVSYRNGVSAYDDCDGEVELKIDNSEVDLSTIGTYHVYYSATDASGNSTQIEIKLTVMPERKDAVTLDQMYAECDAILASILTDDMTQYDQAHAIFNWIRNNVYFINDSQKDDWIQSAHDAIQYGKGDCYNFASLSKALLTRAGIPNIDIKRNSTLSKHFWNLVDCGDGWYHFDTTPRQDKTIIFMWSESQLCGDEPVRRSHVYDKTLYPEVNWD